VSCGLDDTDDTFKLVLRSAVVRAPRHEIAQKAFVVVERAIDMFEKAAAAGDGRAQHGLVSTRAV
jgi:hypothetical protein